MNKSDKIFIAGHNGLVGSAIVRALQTKGFHQLIYQRSTELDLRNQQQVNDFFALEKDLFAMAPQELIEVKVQATYFKAKQVWPR